VAVLIHEVGSASNIASGHDVAELELISCSLNSISSFVTFLVDSFESTSLSASFVVRAVGLVPGSSFITVGVGVYTMSPSPVSVEDDTTSLFSASTCLRASIVCHR